MNLTQGTFYFTISRTIKAKTLCDCYLIEFVENIKLNQSEITPPESADRGISKENIFKSDRQHKKRYK